MTAQPWRGVAAENAEEVTGKLSALLRRRARRLLTALLRPYRRQVTWALVLVVVGERGGAGRALAGRGGHRPRDPAAGARPRRGPAGRHHGRVLRGGRGAGRRHPGVHPGDRPVRRGRGQGTAPPAVRPFPAAAGGVPRAVHLGPGHLPADLGHRLDLRPVRGGPGLAGVRDLLAAAGGRGHAAARLAAGPGGAGRVRPAGGAHPVVPPRVRDRLPAQQGGDRRRDRRLRGDVRRHPRGTGVPPGAPQR